jgi:hypothetical protein
MCLFLIDDPDFAMAFYRGSRLERSPNRGACADFEGPTDAERTRRQHRYGTATIRDDHRRPEPGIATEPAA